MKKLYCALLAVVMVLTTIQFQPANVSATTFTDSDIVNTWTVTQSTTQTDTDVYTSSSGSYLVYKITAGEAGTYSFGTTGNVDTMGYLLDESLNTSSYLKYNDNRGDSNNCRIFYTLAKNETVYFAVRPYTYSYYGSDHAFTVCVEPAEVYNNLVIDEYDSNGDGTIDTYHVVGNILTKATAVTIPEKINNLPVVSIDREAFDECEYITSLVVPSSVKTIGQEAFYQCRNLKKVTLQAGGVEEIEYYAFYSCSNLESITLGEGLKAIYSSAFSNAAIKTLNIPASVDTIYSGAFNGTVNLTSITVDAENEDFKSVDGVLFSKDGKTIYEYPAGKTQSSYTIPEGVVYVDPYCFFKVLNLKSVTCASTVKIIFYNAFNSCFLLSEVNLNEGLEQIGSYAFDSCVSLTDISLPVTVKTIATAAFRNTKLISLTIPASVTSVNSDLVGSCDTIQSVIFENDTVKFPSQKITSEEITIYGNAGSTAETYAGNYSNYTFVDLKSVDCSNEQHSYYAYKYKTVPTCAEKGTAYTKCAVCGKKGPVTDVAKVDHNIINSCYCMTCGQKTMSIANLSLAKAVSGKIMNEMGYYTAIYKVSKDGNYKITVSNPNQHMSFGYTIENSTGDTSCSYGNFTVESGETKSLNISAKAGMCIYITTSHEYGATEDYKFTLELTCNHDTYSTKVVKPTYAAKGYTLHTCKTCGHTYKSNYTAKLTVAAPAIKSVTAGSGKLAIKWGKKAYTGYQVQIATNKKFTKNKQTVTIKKAGTIKTTIKGLKNKTKYYVRVRAYKTYKSKKYYSKWSAVKTQTTK